MAEHWTVAPGVEGSSPFVHPIKKGLGSRVEGLTPIPCSLAPIAQLDRAPDFESVGREFESPWAHHENAVISD